MRRPAFVGVVLLLTALAVSLRAADTQDPAALVRQLGSDDFMAREDTTRALYRLGRTAVPALQQGVKSPDREVRRRCEMLLPLALRSDDEVWLDGFVDGETDRPKVATGWAALQKIAGEGLETRLLFAELYRTDRAILDLLEKDTAKLASQAGERCQKLQQRFVGKVVGPGDEMPATGEVAGALLAAAAGNLDQNVFNQLNNLLYQPAMRTAIQRVPGVDKLVGTILARREGDIYQMSQTIYIARNLGLTDYIETSLKPAVRKLADSVGPDDNQGRFYQLVYMARNLGMEDLIGEKLRPAVHKMAEAAAANPSDAYKFQQAVSMAQLLKMPETMEQVLKPAGLKLIQNAAEKPGDLNQFYQIPYVARMLGLNEAVDAVLKPAAARHIAALVAQPGDVNKFYQAQNIARTLQLQEAVEGVLQPAARKMIVSSIEQSNGDINRVTQSLYLIQSLGMTDLIDDTLKPWVKKQASSLTGKPDDLARLTQLHNAAQTLRLQDLIKSDIEPVFRKVVQAAADQPINANVANQVISMAKSMAVKEAVPYAFRVAQAKEVQGYTRGMAILLLADFGTKEDAAKLETLLDDTTSVGSSGINSTTIHAEVRDVALGVLVHISGQSLADYGFPYYQIVPAARLTTSWAGSLGFANAAGREAAFKKWKEWSEAQKKH